MVRGKRSRSGSHDRDRPSRRRSRSRSRRRYRSRSSSRGSRSPRRSSRYGRSRSRDNERRRRSSSRSDVKSRRSRSRNSSYRTKSCENARDKSRRSGSRTPRYRTKSCDSSREKSDTPPIPDSNKMIADTLANIALAKLNYQINSMSTFDSDNSKKKKKSRWAGSIHDKIFIPGMPTTIPPNLDKKQEQAYLLQLQIEELSRRLRYGDLGIPADPSERSPSPEPIYSNDGKRLNTREFRTRKKLEDERHHLISKMQSINPEFKPPMDYKPQLSKVCDQVVIPQDDYPDINFVGLLIGPRGNTLKLMEKETGAKIIIRGKGSVKEGKVGRKDGHPLPGEDEPLHAYITAVSPESVKKAANRIKEIIRQGVETPEDQNHLRRMQLRELALLNGTLREDAAPMCANCGSLTHKTWSCPNRPNVTASIFCSSCGAAGHIARDCLQKGSTMELISPKIDEEYRTLMSELSVDLESEAQEKKIQKMLLPQPTALTNAPLVSSIPAGNISASSSQPTSWTQDVASMNAVWTAPVGWNAATVPAQWPLCQVPPPSFQLPPPPGVDLTSLLSIPPPPPPPK